MEKNAQQTETHTAVIIKEKKILTRRGKCNYYKSRQSSNEYEHGNLIVHM